MHLVYSKHKRTNKLIMKRNSIKVLLLSVLILSGLSVKAQCPSIDYKKRSVNPLFVEHNWDTIVTCANPSVKIVASTFIPVAMFNGNYIVESIPFNPPDTSFCSTAGGGARITLNSDDGFESVGIQQLPFAFQFFGVPYTRAWAGPNTQVSFWQNRPTSTSTTYNPTSCPLPSSDGAVKGCILGLFSDIDTRYANESHVPNAGVYRAVYDTFPCRKLVVNYKGIPKFGASDRTVDYSTVQIVCYEGTNIIEVHVKKHSHNCSTDSHAATIGINDSTGLHAFYPGPQNGNPNRNVFQNQNLENEAWRFTPNGQTFRNITWYYGNSIADEDQIQNDGINGITFLNDGLGGDTAIIVTPDTTTTYTMRLRFVNSGVGYDLHSSVTIGVVQDHSMNFEADTAICLGQGANITLLNQENTFVSPVHNSWSCDNPLMEWNTNQDQTSINITPEQGAQLFTNGHQHDRDATVTFSLTTGFSNGCNDSAQIKILFVNNIDDTSVAGICKGDSYTYHGETFTTGGYHSVDTATAENCPFKHTLKLTVLNPTDTTINVTSCKPYRWIDDSVYAETTSAPSVLLKNMWNCDSTVRLNFNLDQSLKAIIQASPTEATLDNLHIELRDASISATGREWTLPDGSHSTNVSPYFDFPTDHDSVSISLVAQQVFQSLNATCYDTTSITIPLLREALWMPNAFTPTREPNQVFRAVGVGIIDFHITFFNRNGMVMNSYSGFDNYWDGTDSKGRNCPTGVYTYVCTYSNILNPGRVLSKKGSVTLIR